MEHPIVLWVAGFLGIPAGPAVSLIVAVLIFCYIGGFMMLFSFCGYLTRRGKNSTGLVSLAWFLMALLVCLVVFVLDFFHTILAIFAVISLLSSFGRAAGR